MLTPKEQAELHMALNDVITYECENDAEFFERLIYALQCITNDLSQFKNDLYTLADLLDNNKVEEDEEEGDI